MNFTSDLLELNDHVWERFVTRMQGLSDAEWQWRPTNEPKISLQWRLQHIHDFLSEDRNALWLGASDYTTSSNEPTFPASATQAMVEAQTAYTTWRRLLQSLSAENLQQPVGQVAGKYGDASRYSYVLHVVDELIHHTAEAALLRDLYATQKNLQ